MRAESKTAQLRDLLKEYPEGCRLSLDEVRAFAERVGLTEEYARLVVNGSSRSVGTRIYSSRRFR